MDGDGIADLGEAQIPLGVRPANRLDPALDSIEAAGGVVGALIYGHVSVPLDSKAVDEEIELISVTEDKISAAVGRGHAAGLGGIDDVSRSPDPVADAPQESLLHDGNLTLARGADVQQVVGTHLAAGAKGFDQFGQGFIVVIIGAEAPVVIHGVAHFGGHVLAVPLSVHRRGTTLLKGHAVQLDVADLAAVGQSRVVDDDGTSLYGGVTDKALTSW